AAQIVGSGGRVIGVDANVEMLALAGRYRQEIGDELGYHNVEFRRGHIQDLQLDLTLVEDYLQRTPVTSTAELADFNAFCEEIRRNRPLIDDDSIDVILSNCVLNLVRPEDKERLFAEMFRVTRRGGRVVISDIVSDEDAPDDLKKDPEM